MFWGLKPRQLEVCSCFLAVPQAPSVLGQAPSGHHVSDPTLRTGKALPLGSSDRGEHFSLKSVDSSKAEQLMGTF